MSRTPIWSLNARRYELGRARKWQIYLFKASTGALIAALLSLPLLLNLSAVLVASGAIYVTTKVCYYVNTGDWPDHWTSAADWICDGALHFAWYAVLAAAAGEWRTAVIIAGAWLATYPWSSE